MTGQDLHKRTVVVKVGSSSLAAADRGIDHGRIASLCDRIAELARDWNVVLVTSGAVAAGRGRLAERGSRVASDSHAERAALSAIGQFELLALYQRNLRYHDLEAAQVLLTQRDLNSRFHCEAATDTIKQLLGLGVVPIINSNDAVVEAVSENDGLAARIAIGLDAFRVVLLTDVAGVYATFPPADGDHPLRELRIESLRRLIGEQRSKQTSTSTGLGTGGLATKLEAAAQASRAGIGCVIAPFTEHDVLRRCLLDNPNCGTFVPPSGLRFEPSQRWLGAIAESKGRVKVNEGAEDALRRRHGLLSIGVTGVKGEFEAGDVITVVGRDWRTEIARCRLPVGAEALRTAYGHSAEELTALLRLEPQRYREDNKPMRPDSWTETIDQVRRENEGLEAFRDQDIRWLLARSEPLRRKAFTEIRQMLRVPAEGTAPKLSSLIRYEDTAVIL